MLYVNNLTEIGCAWGSEDVFSRKKNQEMFLMKLLFKLNTQTKTVDFAKKLMGVLWSANTGIKGISIWGEWFMFLGRCLPYVVHIVMQY